MRSFRKRDSVEAAPGFLLFRLDGGYRQIVPVQNIVGVRDRTESDGCAIDLANEHSLLVDLDITEIFAAIETAKGANRAAG